MAEDDEVIRYFASKALQEAGFEILRASSGEQALSIFEAERPDAVLLDVKMPGIDGYETCKRLRELPSGSDTPIMVMTGLDDVQSINRAFEVGATDFITKPINFLLLSHRLRYLLRAANAFWTVKDGAHRLARAQLLARLAQWDLNLGDGTFRWSEEATSIFGIPPVSESRDLSALMRWVHPEDQARVSQALASKCAHRIEYRLITPAGDERFVCQDVEVSTNAASGLTRLIGATQDITERRQAEERAMRLAYYDTLTGLPNRAYFRAFLRQALADAERQGGTLAVLALDLDLFKRVNDMLGHAAGDALLREVSQRLLGCIRASDAVAHSMDCPSHAPQDTKECLAARLGGDEFVVVLPRLRCPQDATVVARRILARLGSPYAIERSELFLSASIGIATFPENGSDAETLLREADAALYHAKERGKNNFQFFNQSIHARAERQVAVENGLRRAMTDMGLLPQSQPGSQAPSGPSEITLHYQPKLVAGTQGLIGMEALLRWKSPTLGRVSPAEFVPVAEDSGLIVPLGEWILRTACAQALVFAAQAGRPLQIAVNISARQFREPGFAGLVARVLAECGLAPQMLELEITEGVVMQDLHAIKSALEELKASGVRIALDDFGTGYSSLGYLTRFPLDTLKIDRSFVRSIGTHTSETIITAIVAMSRSLALDVVAEGVETALQLAFFEQHPAVQIQGFYFAEPMSDEDFAQWLRKRESVRASALGQDDAST